MRLPKSQNKNVNNICIVGNPARMISEQGGVKCRPKKIMCHGDYLIPYHMIRTCVRTDPPLLSFIWRFVYLTCVLSIV
jgi:hypothetical protein